MGVLDLGRCSAAGGVGAGAAGGGVLVEPSNVNSLSSPSRSRVSHSLTRSVGLSCRFGEVTPSSFL